MLRAARRLRTRLRRWRRQWLTARCRHITLRVDRYNLRGLPFERTICRACGLGVEGRMPGGPWPEEELTGRA